MATTPENPARGGQRQEELKASLSCVGTCLKQTFCLLHLVRVESAPFVLFISSM